MKVSSCVLLVLCAAFKASDSQQFDESAWMDNTGRDKYFEYSDLPALTDTNFSNNVDSFQFVEEPEARVINHGAADKKPPLPVRRHTTHLKNKNPNIIDFFVNKIRKVVKGNQVHHSANETSKGLDIKLETSNPNFPPSFGNSQDLKVIYLGTKWCGSGDIARSSRDIGYFYLTDACCRAHDFCPKIIDAQKSDFGLKNSGKFTRLHCDCDNEFHRCLKSVNTFVSHQIGIVYFNVLGGQCFAEDHPVKSCKQYKRNRCVSYDLDTTQPKKYQWFDNKWFL